MQLLNSIHILLKTRNKEGIIQFVKKETMRINNKNISITEYIVNSLGVILLIHDKITISYLVAIFEKYTNPMIYLAILLDEESKRIVKIIDEKYTSKLFYKDEILITPCQSPMVPKMRLVTEEERDELEKQYTIFVTEKLPRLPMNDIMRRWYDFPKNSIVAVIFSDNINFRIVM